MKFKREYQNLERRDKERILKQYRLEKRLSDKLRNANADKRRLLYSSVYDEFFRALPDLPMIKRKENKAYQTSRARRQARLVLNFLRAEDHFLEVGAGDCHLSLEVAKYCEKVYALDVSKEITSSALVPDNFELIISDATSVNLPPDTINVAYSTQLMEHLHPDDAVTHLKRIHKTLASGGMYICITPHRFLGPHDVSKFFGDSPVGFHLKEYTNSELFVLFRQVGFSKVRLIKSTRGLQVRLRPFFPNLVEFVLEPLPHRLRRKAAKLLPFRKFINGPVIGIK